MRQCPRCGMWFANKQAIRRHLGDCPIQKCIDMGALPAGFTLRPKKGE